MKGIYPAIVYIILFSVGVVVFFSIYSFSNNFIANKEAELKDVQAEKICNFIKSIEGKRITAEIELGEYSILTGPLRIIAGTPHLCQIDAITRGNCSGLCRIKSSEREIVFR